MTGDNLTKKATVARLPDVTLAPEHDMGPTRNSVIYACNICDKSYDKKSSYQSHMRLKHKPTKESEVEKGAKVPQKKSGLGLWIENEVDRPLMLTRELDSFLDNRSDTSLVVVAGESKEVQVQVEKLAVRNHEVEWFEEDYNEEFNAEFSSEFASSLRRESLPSQPASNIVEFHNDLMKKQVEKYDAMVVTTTRMLKHAELSKKALRKRIESLEKELEETQENWHGSSEIDSEEIASLKAKIIAQNIKIEELQVAASVPQGKNCQKCEKCSFVTGDSDTLLKHMKSVHGEKQGKKCPKCPKIIANEKLFRMHTKTHQSGTQYQCDICQKTFKSLNDARTHSHKACGNITQKEFVIDIEDVEDNNSCNACSTSYTSKTELEKHMEKHHAANCSTCLATFKSQEDVYKHANKCHEIIEPLICEHCNCELVSKAGLKKHMGRCKGGDTSVSSQNIKQHQSKEKCTNGPKCQFLKENRCLFVHTEKNKKHSSKEHRKFTELNSHICRQKFASQEEKRSHSCQEHDTVMARRKNTDCNRGPSCFRLAQGSCWFKHSTVQNRRRQQGKRSAESKTSSNTTLWCQYQDKCTRNSCTYKHFDQGFQKTQSKKKQ